MRFKLPFWHLKPILCKCGSMGYDAVVMRNTIEVLVELLRGVTFPGHTTSHTRAIIEAQKFLREYDSNGEYTCKQNEQKDQD